LYDQNISHVALTKVVNGPLRIGPAPEDASRMRLSLIAPTYNEASNIHDLVRQLTYQLDAALPNAYEIIVVDDNSPDGTAELALQLTSQYPQLRVLRRDNERGLSTAVIRGWQAARGEILAVIDADLQHPPEVTVRLYEEMDRGADLAVASRHIEGGGVSDWSAMRRVLSRAAQFVGLILLPEVVGRVSDPMSGYFMVRRTAIQGVELNPLGYKILIEVIGRGQCRWIGEVPYLFRERVEGTSKVSRKVYFEYLQHLLRLRLAKLQGNRFIRFAIVGASGVIVDMGLLFLLSDPSAMGWGLTRSKLIAAEFAIVNNFLWNDSWTFGDISSRQQGMFPRLRRFVKFQLICLAGLALNTVLLNVQFNLLHMNRYLANLIAIGAVTGWNFYLNYKLSWSTTETG
jgi:dolichol-phosphate mannosyltransferase